MAKTLHDVCRNQHPTQCQPEDADMTDTDDVDVKNNLEDMRNDYKIPRQQTQPRSTLIGEGWVVN